MFRSTTLVKIAVASLSLSAFAQKTEIPVGEVADDVAGTRQGQEVKLKDIEVKGESNAPNSFGIIEDGSDSPLASISLSRDLLVAVQGNMDRERIERQNGETR